MSVDSSETIIKKAASYLLKGLLGLIEALKFLMAISALWGWYAIDLIGLCLMSASFYDHRENLRQLLAGNSKERAWGVYVATLMVLALIINAAYWGIYLSKQE